LIAVWPATVQLPRRGHDGLDHLADFGLEALDQLGQPLPALLFGLGLQGPPLLVEARDLDVRRLRRGQRRGRGGQRPVQAEGAPDQNGRLQHDDHRVQHHAAQVGAARKHGRGQQEVQHEMVKGDGRRRGQDHAPVGIRRGDRQGREEIHVQVDLPGIALEQEHQQRRHADQRDGDRRVRRQARAVDQPDQRRRRGEAGDHEGRCRHGLAERQRHARDHGQVQPQEPDQESVGCAANPDEVVRHG
jgi:hypothetical protein